MKRIFNVKTTELENKVIDYMKNNIGDLDEWFFANEMKIDGIEKNQLGGVISSLVKKGIIEYDGHESSPAIALTEELA